MLLFAWLFDDCVPKTGPVVCLCLLTEIPATGLVILKGTLHSVNSQQVKNAGTVHPSAMTSEVIIGH